MAHRKLYCMNLLKEYRRVKTKETINVFKNDLMKQNWDEVFRNRMRMVLMMYCLEYLHYCIIQTVQ